MFNKIITCFNDLLAIFNLRNTILIRLSIFYKNLRFTAFDFNFVPFTIFERFIFQIMRFNDSVDTVNHSSKPNECFIDIYRIEIKMIFFSKLGSNDTIRYIIGFETECHDKIIIFFEF